jgi:hypothetical protein
MHGVQSVIWYMIRSILLILTHKSYLLIYFQAFLFIN